MTPRPSSIAQLLNDGCVRTTVRGVAKAKAVRASVGAITSNASEIEIVEADLNSDAGWDTAAIGTRYALHVASPVPRRATERSACSRRRAPPE
jgi:hypothetical protein